MYTSEFDGLKIVLDTVLERDMDLLIIEEMLHSNDFAKRFFSAVKVSEDCKILSIQRSLRFEMGETDILVVLQTPEGDIIDLHIEDKVNAEAQPEQFSRCLAQKVDKTQNVYLRKSKGLWNFMKNYRS